MIEESQKLKSTAEDKASHLADKLVPYTLGGTALTYLLTRNSVKALSVIMVDFSCALKLSMPIAIISAMREFSVALMSRINKNYRFIVGFNFLLIVCGVTGAIQPTTSALLHNMSTLGISVKSMTDLLPEEKE